MIKIFFWNSLTITADPNKYTNMANAYLCGIPNMYIEMMWLIEE